MSAVIYALFFWTLTASASRVSLRGKHDPDDHPGHDDFHDDGGDYDDGDDFHEDYKGMCDDPDSPNYNPDHPKCGGAEMPWCDDPNDPDYDPSDPSCMGGEEMSMDDMEDIHGNGEDNMAEEMTDVDGGPKFEEFDANGDDLIDVNEAVTYGTVNGLPSDEVQDIFDYLDENKDGFVDRDEFDSSKGDEVTEDLAPTHEDLDLNTDGMVDWAEWELACVCGKTYLDTCASETMCKDLYNTADVDGDDLLSKKEFDGAGEACETADDGNCYILRGSGIMLRKLLKVKKSGRAVFALALQRARKFRKAHLKPKPKSSRQHPKSAVMLKRLIARKYGHHQQPRLRRRAAKRSHRMQRGAPRRIAFD